MAGKKISSVSRDLLRATEAIAKNLGVKYCTQCNRTQSVEGGKVFMLSNGRTRWKCAVCTKKQKPAGTL